MTVGGKTFIEAGKIKTEFIDVDTLEVTKLIGATGTFKELQAIDNAGKIQGKFFFNTEGSGDDVSSSFNIDFSRTWISGDLYQQGYNYDESRSWRFYASDIWCRGEFGHRKMTTMFFQSNDNSADFWAHIYAYGTDTTYHKYAKSGQPIDCIILDGSGDFGLRICDSAAYKAVIVCNDSDYQKRIVVNQKNSTVYVLSGRTMHLFITSKVDTTIVNPYRVNNLFY